MEIKKVSAQEFISFANTSPLNNYMQTEEFAKLQEYISYKPEYILFEDNNKYLAGAMILIASIGNYKYGYSPKGFLINYYDANILNTFTRLLKKTYKDLAFIKINPEIVVGEVDCKTMLLTTNTNNKIKNILKNQDYQKLKDNLYFESVNPRFNAYINLSKNKISEYRKETRNKISNSKRKGLYLDNGDINDLNEFYKMINTDKKIGYYRNLLSVFGDSAELLVVRVNYEDYIKKTQKKLSEEENNNNLYNEILHRSKEQSDLNKKMASDKVINGLKNEIIVATDGLKNNNMEIVAGAIVIKHGSRAHVVISGYNKKKKLNQNYFLYYSLISRYKKDFKFLDIGGISGDFNSSSPYRGLNRFKMGFNPNIYEYIGEFDLIIDKRKYKHLLKSGKLADTFNKKVDKK